MSRVKADRKRMLIAYYPYSNDIDLYHGMIQGMLSEKFLVIDYEDLKKGFFRLEDIDAIYLNWLENGMSEKDRALISQAAQMRIPIYWTFHNRISHNRLMENECRENMIFLLQNVSDIIVLSRSSIPYLYEYAPNLEREKIHYMPHPEYIGNYGALENPVLKKAISEKKFVFGCIGNIRDDKNIELVIQAFKRFPYKQTSTLFIVGRLEEADYLAKLTELIGGGRKVSFYFRSIFPII